MKSRILKKPRVTYVALLRGINVGGSNMLSMASLKARFEKLGYSEVRTYINSGNIIFAHDGRAVREIESDIERCIAKDFGMEIKAVVRTAKEIAAVCRKIPAEWTNDAEMKTDVLFLRHDIDSPKVLSEIAANPEADTLIYSKGTVIWNLSRADCRKSGMQGFIATRVYKNMTARNVNTVRKLNGLMSGLLP